MIQTEASLAVVDTIFTLPIKNAGKPTGMTYLEKKLEFSIKTR